MDDLEPVSDLGPNYCRIVLINASLMLWIDICNHQQGLPVCHPDLYDARVDISGNLLRYCTAILEHHKHSQLSDLYCFCETIQGICGLDLDYATTQILHHSAAFKENLQPYLQALCPLYRRNMPYVPFPDSPFHSL